VDACEVLELEPSKAGLAGVAVVVLASAGARFGLVVDRLLGQRDLFVRPLDPRWQGTGCQRRGRVGRWQPGPGLVDVEDLSRTIEKLLAGIGCAASAGRQRPAGGNASASWWWNDSLTVREVERQLLDSTATRSKCGRRIDGWNAVRTGSFDLVIRRRGYAAHERHRIGGPDQAGSSIAVDSGNNRLIQRPGGGRLRGLEAGADYYLNKGSFQDESLFEGRNRPDRGAHGMRIALVNDMVMAVEALRAGAGAGAGIKIAWIARDGAKL